VTLNIRVLEKATGLRPVTQRLAKRMINKLCGINIDLGYVSPSRSDLRILTAGANLTGVHTLLGTSDPGRGGYHIGGMGVLPNEAMIKALAESVERYSQLLAMYHLQHQLPQKFATYAEMLLQKEPIIAQEYLSLYQQQQWRNSAFVFEQWDASKPLQWIKVKSLLSQQDVWCPAQFLFIGYRCQYEKGEPWINAAVTTGTAAHVDYSSALRSALLEVIQIDSAMGHWYTNTIAFAIQLDQRVTALKNLMMKYTGGNRVLPQFYWLRNADLKGFTIACVFVRHKGDSPPRIAIGLGADTHLEQAMYKAFLEAYGVVGFSRMVLFKERFLGSQVNNDPHTMFDLDQNVSYYARGMSYDFFAQKFLHSPVLPASELPQDMQEDVSEQIQELLLGFKLSHKDVIQVDLTSIEARQLGLVVVRAWSPQTLTLCLPSAPHLAHPRYQDYGGAIHDVPHPYP